MEKVKRSDALRCLQRSSTYMVVARGYDGDVFFVNDCLNTYISLLVGDERSNKIQISSKDKKKSHRTQIENMHLTSMYEQTERH